ncbi:MAG TPA: nucleotide kinase domain-containing protein [Acidothermaceae bacterium]|jgi:hypothetical protein
MSDRPGRYDKPVSSPKTTSNGSKHPVPSSGFDIYWRFAAARQVRYRRRLGIGLEHDEPVPGVDDEVIDRHRFTNAYRASDRVSQFLLTDVMYDCDRPWRDVFARTMLFKIFNRIDTWNWLQQQCEDIDANEVFGPRLETALRNLAAHRPVYSAAYIMPPPMTRAGPKYHRHLEMLRDMIRHGLPERIADASSLGEVYELLADWDSVGPFLAYQYATDLNYAEELGHDENTFVVAGPGAARGIRKCFSANADLNPADLIRWVVDRQEHEFAARSLPWHDLWGRPLQLIDAQNLFCEVDKYTRVAHPELSVFAAGARIKQTYRPIGLPMTAWFPPHWGLNERAQASLSNAAPRSNLGPAVTLF